VKEAWACKKWEKEMQSLIEELKKEKKELQKKVNNLKTP
jgi:hypothetical protein